jgi:hypothetical protein
MLPDFLEKYLYENIARTNLHGAPYMDFIGHTDITGNNFLFMDADHLNKTGAKIFSYVLLRSLIDRGYLPQSADGYDYGPLWQTTH